MKQLTQQIAGAYIGAQVEWTNKKWDIYSYGKDGVQINALVVPYDQCRLILTPLSAISDEDAVEVAKMVGYDDTGNGKVCRSFININREIVLDFEQNVFYIKLDTPIIDYLRSRNYDLGYMGIRSLIDAGIAISSLDKTETK